MKRSAALLLLAFATMTASGTSVAQPLEVAPSSTPATAAGFDYDTLFQRMYRAPSDLDASFEFAERAVRQGDYEAAIGALERMLFFNPNLPRVKLELGVLYFKLNSYEMARSYLQEASKGPLSLEDRTQADAYLAEIERRMAPYEYSAFLQAGLRYQTNANFGADSPALRVLGQNVITANQFGKTADWNSFESVSAFYARKLDLRGDAVEVTFQGYNANQFRLRQFDLGFLETTLGPRIAFGQSSSIKPYLIGDAAWLGNAPYFRAGGAGVSARTALGTLGIAEVVVENRWRSFSDSLAFPAANQQSGQDLTAAVSADLGFGALHVTTRLGYEDNRATTAFNSYKRYSIDMTFPYGFTTSVLGVARQFAIAPTVGYSVTNYAAPFALVDPNIIRNDRELHYGAILDAQIYEALGVRTQILYSKSNSSLPNYGTSNFSISIGPTARF